MSIEVVTLKASIENGNNLKTLIQTSGFKGDKGDQGLSGNQPQPYAIIDTTIPTEHFWIRAHPRLALGETIIIESDAKLIVV